MSTVEDWGWVNWYATRRHLPSTEQVYRGVPRSLCGRADLDTIQMDAERRRNLGRKPVNYDAIPKCKFCQRKASTT